MYTRINLPVNLSIARFVDLSLNDAQSHVKPFLWLNSHFKYTQSCLLLANPRTLLPCFQGFYTRLRVVRSQIKKRAIACSFYTQIFVSVVVFYTIKSALVTSSVIPSIFFDNLIVWTTKRRAFARVLHAQSSCVRPAAEACITDVIHEPGNCHLCGWAKAQMLVAACLQPMIQASDVGLHRLKFTSLWRISRSIHHYKYWLNTSCITACAHWPC